MKKLDKRDYLVVNAFADELFEGNPAGVFPEADGLTAVEMQKIARQLNLVETAFVFPADEPELDRYLRFFTPLKELPVTGHPTIAAWTALIHEKLVDPSVQSSYKQKTAAGVQEIKIERLGNKTLIQMMQPKAKFLSIIEDRKRVAEIFDLLESDFYPELPIRAVDTGLGHIIVPIKTIDALMRAQRNINELQQLCEDVGVREAQLFTFETRVTTSDIHTRNLCPRQGIEDPACGVGTGALGAYLAEYHYKEVNEFNFSAEQGHLVQMPSVINVEVIRGTGGELSIFIGGYSVVMSRGRMYL